MIITNQVGLVFKNGELVKVLTAGKYWLAFWENVIVYDMGKNISASGLDIDVLKLNSDFNNLVYSINVQDNELVALYKDGVFLNMLTTGKYNCWKGINEYSTIKFDIKELVVPDNIDMKLLKYMIGSYILEVKVEAYEKALIFINGKYEKILEAGTYFYWKNTNEIKVSKIDIRQIAMDIVGQEILTKDKAQLRLNFNLQYKVNDVEKAVLENKDFDKQLYVIIQLALREYIGGLTFDELMENKNKLAYFILENTKEKLNLLGVELIACGVKDIILPGDMKEIMNQVLIAEKRAQANIITRREETASTRSLLNTAKLMEDNAMLFKLKEMEYVEKIAEKINKISLSGSGQIVDQLKQIFVK